MKPGFLASLTAVLAGAGLAFAQPPQASPSLPITEPMATGEIISEGMILEDQPTNRIWFSAEYLMWWLREYSAPPLATTGPANVFAPGALGQPGTSVLFGGGNLDNELFHGLRLRGVFWLDDEQKHGVELGWFWLAPQHSTSIIGPGPSGVLSRPFFAENFAGIPFVQVNNFPGLSTGSINVGTRTSFWGAEANGLCNLCSGCKGRLDFLVGFRYLNLDEDLSILEDITTQAAIQGLPAGTRIGDLDSFNTHNDFYGGQIGLAGRYYAGNFVFDGRALIAFGGTHQVVDIFGGQSIRQPDGTTNTFTGGLLALPSNIGRHTRDEFSVVPQVEVRVGYQVTPNIRPFIGYNFLAWTDVVRPGGQIDTTLDVTQIPNFLLPPGVQPGNPPRPAVTFRDETFWAQGVTFGLELRW